MIQDLQNIFCQCISTKNKGWGAVTHSHLHKEDIAAAQGLSNSPERSAMISRGRTNEAYDKTYIDTLSITMLAICYLKGKMESTLLEV